MHDVIAYDVTAGVIARVTVNFHRKSTLAEMENFRFYFPP